MNEVDDPMVFDHVADDSLGGKWKIKTDSMARRSGGFAEHAPIHQLCNPLLQQQHFR